MAKKKTTIADIAKTLGVSKTTVSLVLNGKARQTQLSKEMEKRVHDYIREIGYVPNQYAQGLRSGKTRTIGMLVEDISDSFFSAIARQIEERAYQMGYKIVYSSTENETRKAKELLEVYKNNKLDGYIIAPPAGIEDEVKELMAEGYPVVFFDRTLPGIHTDSVMVDNYNSAYEAMKHLINSGYKHIAFMTLSSDQVQMLERERGYLQAISENNAAYIIKRVKYHDDKSHAIGEIEEFIASHAYIDAIFFATNYIAENGLEAIGNLGLQIPNDMGVVVFDDNNMFRLFTPSITAIAQPISEIAEHVINLMLERLTTVAVHEVVDFQTVVLKSNLQIRKSSIKSES
ncbi:LacI family DNA-binding transcriptional regulator [Parapedobacter tibetensis]|uniref:LacI family DNA-binding transcriptional regulator n=1 Tax=Parapedobacter tibetensis TaxID=2972951 RepID=UPI00214D5C04|nr:LacI family DNA-binding transcriptional regulator [Parapedobacter tibetensis]